MSQTSIQRNDAIRFGSAKLEIGADFSSLTDLGAIRDLVVGHKGSTVEILFDNTESIKFFKDGQKMSFKFLLAEIDLTILSQLEQGFVTLATVAGTPVVGATQVIASGALSDKEWIALEHQMGDGTAPSITSIVGATNGALTAAADDWEIVLGPDGRYGIVFNVTEGATLTTMAQIITITYDYTPNAAKELTFADFGQKTEFVARITNTDDAGAVFYVNLENVTNITALSIPFLSDAADDVSTVEFELEGLVTLIHDEQSTT